MKRRKIAVSIVFTRSSGGSAQYVDSVLDALADFNASQYEVKVWPIYPDWIPILESRGLKYSAPPKLYFLRMLGRFLRELRTQKLSPFQRLSHYDRVLTANRKSMEYWKPDCILYLDQSTVISSLPIRQIACIHDVMNRFETDFPEVGLPEIFTLREKIQQSIAQYCDGILVDSEMGKQHIVECYGINPDHIFTLPYTVHSSLLQAKSVKPENIPQHLVGKYLFYPSQFFLHKNHTGLLHAVHLLKQTGLVIPCVFSGTIKQNGYPYFYWLSHKLGLEKQIYVLDYVNYGELSWLYKNARCLIMPTYFGPTNLPPLEALHFDCPVGVSNNYGMSEQLEDAALYFSPDNYGEISEVIKKLWDDTIIRSILADNSKKIIEKTSKQKFSSRLHGIIKTVIDR